jgi:hypothetical protein
MIKTIMTIIDIDKDRYNEYSYNQDGNKKDS